MIASAKYLSSYSDQEPIKKVFEYIKECGAIVAPNKINTHLESMTREIISVNDVIVRDFANISEMLVYEIEKEISYFETHGYFTCYPKANKHGYFYVLDTNPEIYFAARNLSLTEFVVELV